MFKTLSWLDFLISIVLITALYYLVVCLLFYRKQILQYLLPAYSYDTFTKNTNRADNYIKEEHDDTIGTGNETHNLAVKPTETLSAKEEHDILYNTVHDLSDELKTIFLNAAKTKLSRKELKHTLQLKLKKYQHLKGTAFQVAVSNSIQLESQTQCSIYLNEDELKMLWR